MQRVLTGIQSSGEIHLGNILGAIYPALSLAKASKRPAFFFIADLHSFTTQADSTKRQTSTLEVAAAWLACGLNTQQDCFYRQSRLAQVTELAWYLSCFTSYPLLSRGHAFKTKAKNLEQVNVGLFTYPILQAADIALYDATHVPVGRDQVQHLEMGRTMIKGFNRQYGELLVVPETVIAEDVPTVSGTDGRKMSKSYGNIINPFWPEKRLKKAIMRIQTDSKGVMEVKDSATCPVFALYRLVAPMEQVESMRAHYLEGNYGYSQAKKALYEAVMVRFAEERVAFQDYINHPALVEEKLRQGEVKAAAIASKTLRRVRERLGYGRGLRMGD
jgi:tryptophanyl-tRNA synthetase